jgi:hypothetical protein
LRPRLTFWRHAARTTWWIYELEYDGRGYLVVVRAKSWQHGRIRATSAEDAWLPEAAIHDTSRAEKIIRSVLDLTDEQFAIAVRQGKLRRIR